MLLRALEIKGKSAEHNPKSLQFKLGNSLKDSSDGTGLCECCAQSSNRRV